MFAICKVLFGSLCYILNVQCKQILLNFRAHVSGPLKALFYYTLVSLVCVLS